MASSDGQVGVIADASNHAEIFIRTKVYGRTVMAICDTGCERSVVGSRLVKGAPLKPTETKLYAVNGTEIPLCGTLDMPMQIEGLHTTVDVAVSDAVDELILGID